MTFESIELRASNMIMQGNGSLDYGTRKVNMTFTDDQYTPQGGVQAAQQCQQSNPFLMAAGVGFDTVPAVRQWAGYFKFAASVAKDVYELQFGGIDPASLFTQAVTVAQKYIEKAPPVGIGPQQWGIFYLAMPGAATNNVTYEPALELVER